MPKPSEIREHNTRLLTQWIEEVCKENGLKSGTIAGASLTMFIKAMLEMAHNEGIDRVRRNLDRIIELLQAMRAAPHAEAMDEVATAISIRHVAEVHQREDGKVGT